MLFSIQTDFYRFFLLSAKYHFIYFILLSLLFVFYFQVQLIHFVRSFLLSISVKVIFIPLLIWTQHESFFGPFIFTNLISISFFALQVDLAAQSNNKPAINYATCILSCIALALFANYLADLI